MQDGNQTTTTELAGQVAAGAYAAGGDTISNEDGPQMNADNESASRPLLPKQVRKVRIGEAKVERKDGGKWRFVAPVILEEPADAEGGKQVYPGHMETFSFLLEESGGWTQQRANEEWLKTVMAVRGLSGTEGEAEAKALIRETPAGKLARTFVGAVVNAHFDIRERKDTGERQTDVKRLSAIKA